MLSRTVVLAGCAAALLAFLTSLAGSTLADTAQKRDLVTSAEVLEALTGLDYEMRFRRIVRSGNEQVIVGRATDKNGEAVDFLVGLAATDSGKFQATSPLIPYLDDSGGGLGNVWVATNGQSELPGLDGAQEYNRSVMGFDIEKAMLDLVGLPYGP